MRIHLQFNSHFFLHQLKSYRDSKNAPKLMKIIIISFFLSIDILVSNEDSCGSQLHNILRREKENRSLKNIPSNRSCFSFSNEHLFVSSHDTQKRVKNSICTFMFPAKVFLKITEVLQ